MTKDDLIRIAEKAGIDFRKHLEDFHSPYCDGIHIKEMEIFVNLIAAAEREACAVIAFNAKTYLEAAEAIRARGQDGS